MPALNWNAFAVLAGSAEVNFELLCRGVVRLNFGRYGAFRARANQPGVEFHIRLDHECDALGDVGRWWGWQCKWYDLPSGRSLGTTRRNQIEDGIRKTESHVPGVTDWVLWTRHPLTKGDQEWFDGISTQMRLHLWTGDDVDNLLAGEAAILRATYFGELVCTPELLRGRHEEAVAPIRRRWQPEVHQAVDAERELRRMLGESGAWDDLHAVADELRCDANAALEAGGVPSDLARLVEEVANTATVAASALEGIEAGIRKGDLYLLRQEMSERPAAPRPDARAAPRRLRSGNHRAALFVTNALGAFRHGTRLLDRVEDAFGTRLVALLAPAGCGKTQLAAQLTVTTADRPHGVLLHGRDLHAGHTLDDLARRFLIAGQPVPSMEALLAAVDAAGQRARHRLPVVVDGLNEAEDPREWRRLLAALEPTLEKYPYVLFTCTVRPEFEAEALPPDIRRLEIPDFGQDAVEAIRQYFRHYKIDATDARVPIGLLRHPLTLRLVCEVTNPKREKVVGLEAMPGSLTALFDRYIEQAAERIAELSPRTQRYYAQDVRAALDLIGGSLWDRGSRALEVGELRRLLQDEARPWDQSLLRALEQEGVLLRVPGDGAGSHTAPVYDALGGHLVASALLSRHGHAGLQSWLQEPDTTSSLAGPTEDRHPLATDIIYSMVGQLPRRLHSRQLWQMIGEPLRTFTLRLAAELEGAYLDADTVRALISLARQRPAGAPDLLEKFLDARGSVNHPLNAEALDVVLRTMEVADRDLRWSEWIRRRQEVVLRDLERLEERWRDRGSRAGDSLRARWVLWTLTSTVRRLRDQATRTLYWYGRRDPVGIFGLTLESLAINDAYVGERMLAAAYGVVMAHQQHTADFEAQFATFLSGLANALVGPSATSPTLHYLARTYVRGIVAFAKRFYELAIPDAMRDEWTFGPPPVVEALSTDDARGNEVNRTLHMDFANYTLGGLFQERGNYDMSHKGHQAAVAHVRGVVWALGWREANFGDLDKEIAEDRYRSRTSRALSERYGKEYGWVGFFTYAGLLEEQGLLPRDNRRLADVDIDPSFPDPAPIDEGTDIAPSWLSPHVESDPKWIREGEVSVPKQLLYREGIGPLQGPWVAVHGYLEAGDRVLGRRVFGFLSALVVPQMHAGQIASSLAAGSAHPWVSRDVPSDHYTFAGEIPWSPVFASRDWENGDPGAPYREQVAVGKGEHAEVEVLAHRYAWESYHSEMNEAGNALVPSRPFSARFDLRGLAQSFDQVLPDGSRGAVTLGGVDGLDGDILYLREDLLREYVGDRGIVWLVWGERLLHPHPSSPPEWLVDAQQDQADSWRVVRTDADLGVRRPRGAPLAAKSVARKAKAGAGRKGRRRKGKGGP